jgi:GTPase
MIIEKQRVVILGVKDTSADNFNRTMEELVNLASACDMDVVASFQQVASTGSTTYIGSGKIEEIKNFCKENDVGTVITLHELSPSQLRNLDEALDLAVFDRTALILEIFARRAKSKEAKLQVDVARLQYEMPRMIGSYAALSRQAGSQGEMRSRGTGETKLELDRRRIERQIHEMNQDLQLIAQQRQVQRRKRKKQGLFNVALVGYTNAGKSTLMNRLISVSQNGVAEKEVFVKDQLFATLETSVRNIHIPPYPPFILSDTVGFVSNLPHQLIKAFRSTLEEAIEADILLHVVDFSDPDHQVHIDITRDTLRDIGAGSIEEILVLNKSDLSSESFVPNGHSSIRISALTGAGIDELVKMLFDFRFQSESIHILLPYERMDMLFLIQEECMTLTSVEDEFGYRMTIKGPGYILERLKEFKD